MHVLKTLLAQVKEFTRDSILTPIFMLVEVAMEMVIPLLMASIIDGRKIRSKGVCRICQKPA